MLTNLQDHVPESYMLVLLYFYCYSIEHFIHVVIYFEGTLSGTPIEKCKISQGDHFLLRHLITTFKSVTLTSLWHC